MRVEKRYAYYSAAIRAGISMGRQTFDRWGGAHGAACALGSGLRALGVPATSASASSVFYTHYRYMTAPRTTHCPAEGLKCANFTSLRDAAMHLNDYHRWSRERIADWLYAEEEKLGFITLIETEASNELFLEATTAECQGSVLH